MRLGHTRFMDIRIEYQGVEYPIGFGIQLMGDDPECDIRIPRPPHTASFFGGMAGAVVRVGDEVRLFGFGETPGLQVSGKSYARLRAELSQSRGFRERPSHNLRKEFLLWGQAAFLRWVPAKSPLFQSCRSFRELLDLYRSARDLGETGTKGIVDARGDKKLKELLAFALQDFDLRVADSKSPGSFTLHSQTSSFAPLTVSMRAKVQNTEILPPVPAASPQAPLEAARLAVTEVGRCLDQVLPDLNSKEAQKPRAELASLRVPLQEFSVRGLSEIWPPRLRHIDSGFSDEKELPALLVSCFDGQLQVVRPGSSPRLSYEGRRSWRIDPKANTPFQVEGPRQKFEASWEPKSGAFVLPRGARLHLSEWHPPALQMIRLGFLDTPSSPSSNRVWKYLAFLLSTTQSYGAWIVNEEQGQFTGACLTSSEDQQMVSQNWCLPRSFDWIRKHGPKAPTFQSDDLAGAACLLTQEAQNYIRGECLDVGPVIRVNQGSYTVFLWRHAGSEPFLKEDLCVAEALAHIVKANGATVPLSPLVLSSPRPRPVPQRGELCHGAFRIPLGDLTTLGMSPQREGWLGLSECTSRYHAAIYFDGLDFQIFDLRSRNGTFLNGAPLQAGVARFGDEVSFSNGLSLRLQADREMAGLRFPKNPVFFLSEGEQREIPESVFLEGSILLSLGECRAAGESVEEVWENADFSRWADYFKRNPDRMEAPPRNFSNAPLLRSKDHSVYLDRPRWVGRDPGSDLCLSDPAVSRRHAVFLPHQDKSDVAWFLDLGSYEGVLVRGKKQQYGLITKRSELTVAGHSLELEGPEASSGAALSREERQKLLWVYLGEQWENHSKFSLAMSQQLGVCKCIVVRQAARLEPVYWRSFQGSDVWNVEEYLQKPGVKKILNRVQETQRPFLGATDTAVHEARYLGTVCLGDPTGEPTVLAIPLPSDQWGEAVLLAFSSRPVATALEGWQMDILGGLGQQLKKGKH